MEGRGVLLCCCPVHIEGNVFLCRFREGKEKVLVTTNLCARGIDVEQVTVVVNYDIPVDVNKRPDCETYLHRYARQNSDN